MYKRLFASIIFAALILTVPVWADIQDDLIGYWPMDEGSGGTVADASGNSNDGAAHDTSWVDGRYNSALEFDGVASFVDIPYFPELSPNWRGNYGCLGISNRYHQKLHRWSIRGVWYGAVYRFAAQVSHLG